MLQKKLVRMLIMPLVLFSSELAAHAQTTSRSLQIAAAGTDRVGQYGFASESSSLDSSAEPSSGLGIRRPIAPAVQPVKKHAGTRPFSTVALGIKADTLGTGLELATPLSRSFNLRTGANIFAFGYAFNIDGVDYDSDLHFRSAQVNLDWFPFHGRFHISPGVLYAKNSLTAIASVSPGAYFELGSQGFINTVDDPLNGSAAIKFPHEIAPMIMIGFGNLIPRSGKHFSMPVEVGAAFIGTPTVNVQLSGTACTNEGCFDAATNPDVQKGLADEIIKLNKRLSNIPVYPIVSVGFAYRF
jgi:hypothetical protein